MQNTPDMNKDKLQKINSINSMMIAVENLLHGIDNIENAFAKKAIQEVKWWAGLSFLKHKPEVSDSTPPAPVVEPTQPAAPMPVINPISPATPSPVDNMPPPPPAA
jgi:hypothetical protein